MKKVDTLYCISKVEKGVRSFQMPDPRRWSLDMAEAQFYHTIGEAKATVMDNIREWIGWYNLYNIKKQDRARYEIVKAEMKISVIEC